MATVADAVRVVAKELRSPLGRVKHHSRRLQEEGILPLAVGTSVPRITVEELASLIVAVAVDRDIKLAATSVSEYRNIFRGGMQPDMLPERMQPDAPDAVRYLAFVLAAFAEPDGASELSGLIFEFGCSWPSLRILDRDGQRIMAFSEPGNPGTHWSDDAVRRSACVTSLALYRIVKSLEI